MTQVQAINLTTGAIKANSSGKSKATPEEESAAAIAMFSGIMQEAQSDNLFAQTDTKDTSSDLFGIVDGISSKKSDAKTDYEVMNSSKPARVEKAKEQPTGQDKVTEHTQAVKDTANKVAEKVEETYGVSEEELENALETLGFTVVDLLDTSKLASLVAELAGADDTVSLVSDATFTDLLGTVNDMVNNLLDTQGMNKTDFRQLLADINASLQNDFLAEVNPEIENQEGNGVAIGEGFEAVNPDDEQIVDSTIVQENVDGGEKITTDAVTTGVTTGVVTDDKSVVREEKNTQTVTDRVFDENVITDEKEVVKEVSTEENEGRDFSRPQEKKDLGALDESDVDASTDKTKTNDNSFNIFDKEPQNHAQTNAAQVNTAQAQPAFTDASATAPVAQVAYTYEDIQNLMEQVNGAARAIATSDSHTIQMQLNPENLGRLFMSVSEKQGAVTAQIQVTNEETKAALQSQMVELKANLQAQGIKVEAVEVTVASHEFEQNLESQDTSNREMMERQAREQMEGNEGGKGNGPRGINMGDLDSLSGLMTEEEQIVASMMQMNGQTLDYKA